MELKETSAEKLVLERDPRLETALLFALAALFGAAGTAGLIAGQGVGVLGLVFAASALVYFGFFTERELVVFDRTAGTVTRTIRGLRGARDDHWPLGGLACAELHKPGRDPVVSAPASGAKTRAVLAYADGQTHPLTEGYSRGTGPAHIVQVINEWLGVA